MSLSKLQEIVKDWAAWCAVVHGVHSMGSQRVGPDLVTEQQHLIPIYIISLNIYMISPTYSHIDRMQGNGRYMEQP